MTAPVVIAMPGNEAMAASLAQRLDGEVGRLEVRSFPDGETYLRFVTDLAGRRLVLVCTLDHPNNKILSLLFAAATAREIGAASVGLVAPYLAYMRQDRQFNPGEAMTSRYVGRLLSDVFDWMVTVDPHLHRYRSLAEIYHISTRVVHAAPLISEWIRQNIANPLIIGPDVESEQWVAAVANDAAAPFTVLQKVRRGDQDVQVSFKDPLEFGGRTPVLVDDIVSSGRTMIESVRLIMAHGGVAPVCIAVHGLFANGSDAALARAGARVITTNSIPHETNGIDVAGILAEAITELDFGHFISSAY